METWVLMFYVMSVPIFDGGLYQTEERCVLGALQQMPHWQRAYPHRLKWKCALKT